MASDIVDAARDDAADPVKAGLEAAETGEGKGGREASFKPRGSPSEAFTGGLGQSFDWTPRLEAMKEQAEQEELEQQMKLQRGFWTG